MRATVTLEGTLSVQAALDARSRPVDTLYLADDLPERVGRTLIDLAVRRGCIVTRLPRPALDALTGGRRHGGVVALAGPRRLTSLASVLTGPDRFLAMLDGVEDPHTLGQSIRALYAAGAHGVLLAERAWDAATTLVARASAGASERMPTVSVHDVEALVAEVHGSGLRIVCASRDGLPAYDIDLTGPLVIVVGGERRGISRTVERAADVLVTLPYGRRFDCALDATSATAALAFEVARQRRHRDVQRSGEARSAAGPTPRR